MFIKRKDTGPFQKSFFALANLMTLEQTDVGPPLTLKECQMDKDAYIRLWESRVSQGFALPQDLERVIYAMKETEQPNQSHSFSIHIQGYASAQSLLTEPLIIHGHPNGSLLNDLIWPIERHLRVPYTHWELFSAETGERIDVEKGSMASYTLFWLKDVSLPWKLWLVSKKGGRDYYQFMEDQIVSNLQDETQTKLCSYLSHLHVHMSKFLNSTVQSWSRDQCKQLQNHFQIVHHDIRYIDEDEIRTMRLIVHLSPLKAKENAKGLQLALDYHHRVRLDRVDHGCWLACRWADAKADLNLNPVKEPMDKESIPSPISNCLFTSTSPVAEEEKWHLIWSEIPRHQKKMHIQSAQWQVLMERIMDDASASVKEWIQLCHVLVGLPVPPSVPDTHDLFVDPEWYLQ